MAGSRHGWAADLRAALRREGATIRARDPELDAGDLGQFTLPLLLRLVLLVLVGLVPLLGIRMTDGTETTVFGPFLASVALAAICTCAVAWLVAILLSGLTVLVVYRDTPRRASRETSRATRESFVRISDFTSTFTLVALIAGLVALAIGLPSRASSDLETPVLEDLLAAQVGCLLVVLAVGFVVEALRASADILDSESRIFAWPLALVLTIVAFYIAATAGPFEPTRLVMNLLTEWLPAEVDGVPRDEAVRSAVPPGARGWTLAAIAPMCLIVWLATTHAVGALAQLRADVSAAGAATRARTIA